VRHLGLNHGLPHEIDSFATVVFQIVTAMLSGEAGPSQQFPGRRQCGGWLFGHQRANLGRGFFKAGRAGE
jgi:hypothetical protein